MTTLRVVSRNKFCYSFVFLHEPTESSVQADAVLDSEADEAAKIRQV